MHKRRCRCRRLCPAGARGEADADRVEALNTCSRRQDVAIAGLSVQPPVYAGCSLPASILRHTPSAHIMGAVVQLVEYWTRAGARSPRTPRPGGPHDPQGHHDQLVNFFTAHTPLRHIRVQFYSVHVATNHWFDSRLSRKSLKLWPPDVRF